jgi:hypothetical protein
MPTQTQTFSLAEFVEFASGCFRIEVSVSLDPIPPNLNHEQKGCPAVNPRRNRRDFRPVNDHVDLTSMRTGYAKVSLSSPQDLTQFGHSFAP